MSQPAPVNETPKTNTTKIQALIDQEIADSLKMLEELEASTEITTMVDSFVDSRSDYLLKKLVDIADKNGGLKELGHLWFEFYHKQEYKNLYVIWLLATRKQFREPILKVLSPLIVAEKMMAALAQKQEEAKKQK